MNPVEGKNQLPRQNHLPRRPDGIERAADILRDRWTILILREAFYGVRRYGEMVRNLDIARNVLAARLKALVADGLLERRRYRTDPDWYEYALTPAGRDLYGAIVALLHWADVHRPAGSDQTLRLRHRACGKLTHAKVVCAACGDELDPREVDVELSDRGASASAAPREQPPTRGARRR
jgi:DNA-binding HxlR family transcriptional regulator